MKTATAVLASFAFLALGNPAFAAEDGCESIRQAIRDLPAEGGEVVIPAGTFECRAMIQIKKSNVKLKGAGRSRTILRLGNMAHAPVLVIGDERIHQNEAGDWVTVTRVNNIEILDLTVDGNVANQDVTQECGNGPCDGNLSSIRNNAITIRGATDVRVNRVAAHSAISGGMVTEKYCFDLKVADFTSYGNHFDGFAGYQTVNSVFENMNLSRNRGAGISIDIDFNSNRFVGGILASNGDVGIFARDINDVVFENLIITRSGNHGVFLAESEYPDTCVNRTEFRSVVIDRSEGHGIDLASPCQGNTITGRSVLEKNRQGCYFVNSGTTMAVDPSVACIN